MVVFGFVAVDGLLAIEQKMLDTKINDASHSVVLPSMFFWSPIDFIGSESLVFPSVVSCRLIPLLLLYC
jgi:hypothetical protein